MRKRERERREEGGKEKRGEGVSGLSNTLLQQVHSINVEGKVIKLQVVSL